MVKIQHDKRPKTTMVQLWLSLETHIIPENNNVNSWTVHQNLPTMSMQTTPTPIQFRSMQKKRTGEER